MLQRSIPELVGMSSKSIINFLDAIEANKIEIHSLMIICNGKVITEGEFKPYNKELPHALYSLSKSFTSTAIGLAVSEGLISVEDKLIDLFPEDLPEDVSPNLASIRIKDLLTMSTGHEEDTLPFMLLEENPIKVFFSLPVKYKPSTHFMYHNGATYILAYILKKVTKLQLVDYLMPRLFEPLEIDKPYWEVSPHGINFGAYGLYLNIEDIAKFGLLYLNKGIYNQKRIISEAWITEATSKHVDNNTGGSEDWSQGYCYQFWRCRHNVYRADGAFGQYCVVLPQSNAVVAINSGIENMHIVLNLIWEHLLPAFSNNSLVENKIDYRILCEKCANLKHLPKRVSDREAIINVINDKVFTLEQNNVNLKIIVINFNENKLSLVDDRGKFDVHFGKGEWHYINSNFFNYFTNVYCSGTWLTEHTFIIEARVIETPFTYYLKFTFNDNELVLEYFSNLGFYNDKEIARIHGKAVL
ncbi:MAG: class beta-lactamase-related serine hydrolase [Haloplasmataceae bacterium]|jgi:CubicO group peptidase (beta-lactamase class C family)|nr:class beta-lactamase-related serine hydrolase [Haloplasmataceae bacterium]